MEKGEGAVDPSVSLQPVPCLSPADVESSNETNCLGMKSAPSCNYDKEIDPANPWSNFDFLSLVLPPTPEDSVTSSLDVEHGQDALLEEISTDTDAFQKITISENLPGSVICTKEQLRFSSYQQLQVDAELTKLIPTASCHLSSAAPVPTDSLSAVLPELFDSPDLDLLSNQHNVEVSGEISACNFSSFSDDSSQSKPDSLNQSTGDATLQQEDEAPETSGKKGTDACCMGKKEKRARNALKFPPCVICSGKASGSHYGAITCEACKGFFRRYLQKKIEYKCTKGGNCEITSCNRGNLNCSGCRLKKCLMFGMSKEKSKIGRYTLSKRTEAIINMKKLEGVEVSDTAEENNTLPVDTEAEIGSCDPEKEYLKAQVINNVENLNRSNGFNDLLVSELMEAFDAMEPYGPNIKTKEQIMETHKLHAERYQQKAELFGNMKCVPREEYNKLYEEFGIDVDGRMADMKIEIEHLGSDVAKYYNFAKHIPGFYRLPIEDQIKLLKYSIHEFFTVVMIEAYSQEYNTFIASNGNGYHFEEIAGREFSRECCMLSRDTYSRWQRLALGRDEIALIAALTLVATDRCKLKNYAAVEKIQLALTDLLQMQLRKNHKGAAGKMLTKIFDTLVFTRDMMQLVVKENNSLCKDDLLRKEFPFIEEFVVEDD